MNNEEKLEEEKRIRIKKEKIARNEFIKEKKRLLYQAQTSFGKMILAKYPSNPQYTIGKSSRNKKQTKKNSSSSVSFSISLSSNPNTVDIYNKSSPKWSLGYGERAPLSKGSPYEYYNHPYDPYTDISLLPKKWNQIKGGAALVEKRSKENLFETVPGPERYEPNYSLRVKRSPSYHFGMKLLQSFLKNNSGTGANVAPGSYNQNNIDKISRHRLAFSYSFCVSKRKTLENITWSRNESYYNYSSLGPQIMANKKTFPIKSFTKSTRETTGKCGMFKSMMEQRPTKIRIALPKI